MTTEESQLNDVTRQHHFNSHEIQFAFFFVVVLFLGCDLHTVYGFQSPRNHSASPSALQQQQTFYDKLYRDEHAKASSSRKAYWPLCSSHQEPGSSCSEPATSSNSRPMSKRARLMNMIGVKKLLTNDKVGVEETEAETTEGPPDGLKKHEVTTVEELEDYFSDKKRRFRTKKRKKAVEKFELESDCDVDYNTLLASLSVKGDTQIIGSPDHMDFVHPVAQLLHERRRNKSPLTPSKQTRPDGFKVALAIEGGGMRGCVTAGMTTAIYYLGLEDCFDVVYGSSAGTVIGSYFITRQLPWFGPEIYYDRLTTAGKSFIDTRRFLRTVGLGLLNPRLMKDVIVRPNNGKPVLNLDFLLKETLQKTKPLHWNKFVEMQKVQPLKVVASGLRSQSSVVFDMEHGGFQSLDELSKCMHASCLLPGIAGPVMNSHHNQHSTNAQPMMNKKPQNTMKSGGSPEDEMKFLLGNNMAESTLEPLVDALVYEPLPFRSALKEGATHVVVLRSRPDGVDVTGKSSLFERLIFRRYFLKKNKLRHIYEYMQRHYHKKLYANEVIVLNEAAKDSRHFNDTSSSSPYLMAIAVPPGSAEITRLETRRVAIFEGVRRGFARAYDALVEDTNERGRGAIIAKQAFPDEILKYDPLTIIVDSKDKSAFEVYLEKISGEEGHHLSSFLGKSALEAGLPR